MSDDMTVEKVQALITRGPYHQWLGLKVIAVHDDGIELTATWREEWVVNPERRYTHGGILAALVDLAADWAMVKKTGRRCRPSTCASTITPPRCRATSPRKGKVVRRAASSRCAEAHRLRQGRQAPRQSGRGTYFTAPPPPPKGVIERRSLRRCLTLHQSRRPDRPRPRPDEDRGHRSRRRGGAARIQLCASSTPWRTASRARWPGAASPAATGSPSSPPTAPNFSRPITASCAPASSRCR